MSVTFRFLLKLILLFIFATNQLSGQTLPFNFGFEAGTFAGWTGATGQCCPLYMPNPGIDTSRHVITSGTYTDPYSNGMIPVVAPLSSFSARLGNDNNSAESEALEYSFLVPGDSLLLNIQFAVILENGLHPPVKQPRFSYQVTAGSTQLEGCTFGQVVAGEGVPDFIFNVNLELFQWQQKTISLINLAGENITIRFETGDCGPGGHFGYAYVDCELVSAAITTEGCNANGSMVLIAPTGVQGTWFNGSTADSLIISDPMANGEYYYEINSGSDCAFRIYKQLDPIVPQASFTTISNCENEIVFTNTSSFEPGTIFEWHFGDGETSYEVNPTWFYNQPGTYIVTLNVTEPDFCKALYIGEIILLPDPEIEISTVPACEGKPFNFDCNISSATSYSWLVNNVSMYYTNSATHVFENAGSHQLTLDVEDNNGCHYTKTTTVEVIPAEICDPAVVTPWLPNAFTPNGDGLNDFFEPLKNDLFIDMNLVIYNRFGQLIFEGEKWNGVFLKTECPQGVYSYQLTYKTTNTHKVKTGVLQLIR